MLRNYTWRNCHTLRKISTLLLVLYKGTSKKYANVMRLRHTKMFE